MDRRLLYPYTREGSSMPPPSVEEEFLHLLSHMNPTKLAHLIRAWKHKLSSTPLVPSLILASTHFYHAIYPHHSVDEYIAFFSDTLNKLFDVETQLCFICSMSKTLNMLPIPALTKLPESARDEEGLIPLSEIVFLEYYDFIDSIALLKTARGINSVGAEKQNPLHDYITKRRGELYSEDVLGFFRVSPPRLITFYGNGAVEPVEALERGEICRMLAEVLREEVDRPQASVRRN